MRESTLALRAEKVSSEAPERVLPGTGGASFYVISLLVCSCGVPAFNGMGIQALLNGRPFSNNGHDVHPQVEGAASSSTGRGRL